MTTRPFPHEPWTPVPNRLLEGLVQGRASQGDRLEAWVWQNLSGGADRAELTDMRIERVQGAIGVNSHGNAARLRSQVVERMGLVKGDGAGSYFLKLAATPDDTLQSGPEAPFQDTTEGPLNKGQEGVHRPVSGDVTDGSGDSGQGVQDDMSSPGFDTSIRNPMACLGDDDDALRAAIPEHVPEVRKGTAEGKSGDVPDAGAVTVGGAPPKREGLWALDDSFMLDPDMGMFVIRDPVTGEFVPAPGQ